MKTSNLNPTPSIRTTVMKRSGALLLSAFCVLSFSSCDKDDDPIVDTLNQQDRNFAVTSSQFLNTQTSMGQLAVEKGEDDSVLDYGKMILDKTTESREEFKSILDTRDIDYSDGMAEEMQAKYDELALLSGKDFDMAFIDHQIEMLDDSISMFQNQIDNGQNFTMKGYATKTIELIKDQRREALLVKAELEIEDL
jgi:putative membrane protein